MSDTFTERKPITVLEEIADGIPVTAPDGGLPIAPAVGSAPFPTSATDVVVTGTITVTNNVPAGVAPAGSAVEIVTEGKASIAIQTIGTYTGALTLQGTVNGTNWITIGGLPLFNMTTGVGAATITTGQQNIYTASVVAFSKVRITGLAAVTGTANITMRASQITDLMALEGSLPIGSNGIGTVALTAGTSSIGNILGIAPSTSIGGYALFHKLISAATTNSTLVRTGICAIGSVTLANTTGTFKYWKLYSKATAPTVGTDVPIMTVAIPPNSVQHLTFPYSIRPLLGLVYGITGAAADNDTTAVAAGEVIVNIAYA